MKDLSEQIDIYEAIRNRKSCRACLKQDVNLDILDIIEKILELQNGKYQTERMNPALSLIVRKRANYKMKKLETFLKTSPGIC
jgi:hypothetical protein